MTAPSPASTGTPSIIACPQQASWDTVPQPQLLPQLFPQALQGLQQLRRQVLQQVLQQGVQDTTAVQQQGLLWQVLQQRTGRQRVGRQQRTGRQRCGRQQRGWQQPASAVELTANNIAAPIKIIIHTVTKRFIDRPPIQQSDFRNPFGTCRLRSYTSRRFPNGKPQRIGKRDNLAIFSDLSTEPRRIDEQVGSSWTWNTIKINF
jgi:hypothetical protein